MQVAVLGIGYVGAVTAACLARDGHHVIAVDTDMRKVERLLQGRSPIVEPGLDALTLSAVESGRLRVSANPAEAITVADLSFVCVGTPGRSNGGINLDYVVRACEQIGTALRTRHDFHAVVVRSTMLPGSTASIVVPILERASGKRAGAHFGVAFCPEFLREGSAIRDYSEAPDLIAGTGDERTLRLLRQLNGDRPVVACEPAVAEMLKYANNAWHAVKVVFANEIGALSSSLGIDGAHVMTLLCADRKLNISSAYMRPGFAFGGSCLPKDLKALLYKARQLDVSCPLLEAAPASNEQQIRRACEMVQAAGRRRVGLIGLTFKGGTDDLRDSPAVELAERLIGKGYDIRIFDRNVSLARLSGSNLAFIEGRLPHLAALLCNDVAEVTRHGDTLVLVHGDQPDALALRRHRGDQVLIDLIGALGANELEHTHGRRG